MEWSDAVKLFIWDKDWRTDYSSGVAAVIANDADEARNLLRACVGHDGYDADIANGPDREEELTLPGVMINEGGGS